MTTWDSIAAAEREAKLCEADARIAGFTEAALGVVAASEREKAGYWRQRAADLRERAREEAREWRRKGDAP